MEKGYNGWTNYETWCVNLWITNDQGLIEHFQEQAEYILSNIEDYPESFLADYIKNYFEEVQPETTGVFADLLNSALQQVNWYEIAKSIVNEVNNE